MHCLPRAGKLLLTDLARQLVGVCSDLLALNVLHFIGIIDCDTLEGLPRLESFGRNTDILTVLGVREHS